MEGGVVVRQWSHKRQWISDRLSDVDIGLVVRQCSWGWLSDGRHRRRSDWSSRHQVPHSLPEAGVGAGGPWFGGPYEGGAPLDEVLEARGQVAVVSGAGGLSQLDQDHTEVPLHQGLMEPHLPVVGIR